jgi:hypothetical protein
MVQFSFSKVSISMKGMCDMTTGPGKGIPPILRGDGITGTERRLQALAEKSFLKFWTYPRVFRDQGGGKEICDLLVVFGDDILICSDKDVRFDRAGRLTTAWSRWFSRAVEAGAKQVFGAERWIRKYPGRIFLDPQCQRMFPFGLPSSPRFHRIVVAHGTRAACRAYFGPGSSGSLFIDTGILDDDHKSERGLFRVGRVGSGAGYVHVFDDVTLDILFKTLDTAPDFIAYLIKKEALIASRECVLAAGEEDLLASYLSQLNDAGEHDFVVATEVNCVGYDEGIWTSFQENPQRQAQIRENAISYAWDGLIEKFSHHVLNGTQYFSDGSPPSESEISLRMMASETRTRRRALARTLLGGLSRLGPGEVLRRVVAPQRHGPYYIFLVMPRPVDIAYEQYRWTRCQHLLDLCKVCRHMLPAAQDIVGIATEAGWMPERSEDLLYLDGRNWTAEEDAEAKQIQADHGFLTKTSMFSHWVEEYPPIPETQRVKPARRYPRNAPCHCGSGRKYKKCCGR